MSFSINGSATGSTFQARPPATYTVAATSYADDGANFHVVVSNGVGTVTSASAALTVVAIAPVFVGQPADQTVQEGASATFQVVVQGSALTLSVAARRRRPPRGHRRDLYLEQCPALRLGRELPVVVTNPATTLVSTPAVLTVTPGIPTILAQPEDATAVEGEPASFAVQAEGSLLAYQWYRDGVAIPGAIEATYALASVAYTDNGANFLVEVSNPQGRSAAQSRRSP